jgi:nucleoid DNA-binding protein
LAWWLITRLFSHYPRVFYLELGQALGGWFFDVLESLAAPWARVYAPSIIENCRLEPYYRARLSQDYGEWLARLNDPPLAGTAPRQHDTAATDGNGGRMPRNESENTIMGPEELIAAIEEKRPGLLEGEVSDETAGALLMQAFQIIQERLDRLPEGVLKIRGLGTFRVRNVERTDGPSRVTRRVISLNIAPSESKST